MKKSQPKVYSEADRERIVAHVCKQHGEKKRSITSILREDKGMPNLTTLYAWRDENPLFSQRLARAREAYIEQLLEETIDIAEDASDDIEIWTDPKTKRQYPRLTGSSVKRAALRIQTRERFAILAMPEKYGTQRMDVTSGGKALPAPSEGRDNRLDAILALALSRRQQALPGNEPIDVTPEPSLDDVMS